MTPRAQAASLMRELRACGDAARSAATQNYFPTRQEILGVYAADLRAIARGYRATLAQQPRTFVLNLAQALIAHSTLEGRQLAYELAGSHKAVMAGLTRRELERLGWGMDNWASVDGFCCLLAGVAWRQGRLKDSVIQAWGRSRNPWWRRAALVCTVPLNTRSRGGRGDAGRTLAICELLHGDRHPMVQKALSWALRALSAWDHDSAAQFLQTHPDLPAVVRREVGRKLATGRKNG